MISPPTRTDSLFGLRQLRIIQLLISCAHISMLDFAEARRSSLPNLNDA